MKKGFIFSFDSFLALIIYTLFTVLIYFFFVFSSPTTQQYYFSEDLINTIDNVKVSEISSYPEVQVMINDGRIKDPSLTIIEQILTFQLDQDTSSACELFNITKKNLLPKGFEASFDLDSGSICGGEITRVTNLISRNRIAVGRKQA